MAETSPMLQPGETIKPKVSEDDVKETLRDVYGLKCVSIKELNGYDDNNYHVKVNEITSNGYINNISQDGYTLKIMNSMDSKKPRCFEAQTELLIHLDKKNIRCPKPVRTKDGQYYTIKKFSSGDHLVRLLEFISGSILHQVPTSTDLFRQTGEFVANLDNALKDFHHPVYDTYRFLWMMQSAPQLHQFLFAVADESRRKLVETVLEEFSTRVLSSSSQLKKGMIHGDFNGHNILVEQKNGRWVIKAVLDFGDSHYGCYLYELAITMTYMMIEGKSIETGGDVLAGYTSVRRLPMEEFNLLKVCIACRLCQSLVIGAYTICQDPENLYLLTTAKAGWILLEELWAQPEDKLLELWRSFVRFV